MEYGRALSVFHVSADLGELVDKWNGAPLLLGCDSGAFDWLAGAGQTGEAQAHGWPARPACARQRANARNGSPGPETPGATRRQTFERERYAVKLG